MGWGGKKFHGKDASRCSLSYVGISIIACVVAGAVKYILQKLLRENYAMRDRLVGKPLGRYKVPNRTIRNYFIPISFLYIPLTIIF